MHRDMDLGANASETPLLLHPPFSLLLKALLLWQTGAFVLVGSGRWAAEEQCHPPTHSCFPTCSSEHREHCSAQGSLAWQHGQGSPCPYVAIRSGGILSLWGFPRQGGRCGLAPSAQHQVFHDVNAHMPSLLLCSLLLNSNCSHQPVSLKMCHIFQKNRFGGYLAASVK